MPPFQVRIGVRGYELDPRGHLNHSVYLQYAEHARWEYLRAAGVTEEALAGRGVGPAALENTIRYHAELRAGDEVDVGCEFGWSGGKTFRVRQDFHRPTGELVAALTGVVGLLDLTRRRLVADPAGVLGELAISRPLLGL